MSANGSTMETLLTKADQRKVRKVLEQLEEANAALFMIDLRAYRGQPDTKELIISVRGRIAQLYTLLATLVPPPL